MSYIDGFIIAVPEANKQAFIDHARLVDDLFMTLGATRILECWGDEIPGGRVTDFRRAVQAGDDEAVVFSWIEWPDRTTRDTGMARFQELAKTDPRMDPAQTSIPFDGTRMIYGGFVPLVVLEKP